MELEMWVFGIEIVIHCPSCGKTDFYQPKSWKNAGFGTWHRCKNCHLDIQIDKQEAELSLVFEDDAEKPKVL